LDLGSQLLTCSDEACRVLGLDVGAPIAFERFLQCIHPEDRDRVHETMQASGQSLALWHDEYRVQFPDGREIWVRHLVCS
ncbi:PAS domain-containing protein, partial [Streptomyces sp. P9(2023)]|uniref:PAS domain-containing protein n=1 Tax=Streptomyces sp. P9(2023) TaxID=3064394 RepID=UPI0037DD41D1